MLQEDAAGLIRDLPRMIARIFALDGVVLYVRDQDQFYTSTTDLPMSIQASLRAMTLGDESDPAIPGALHGDDADAGPAAGGGAGPAAGAAFSRGGHVRSARRWPSRSLAALRLRPPRAWKRRARENGCAPR